MRVIYRGDLDGVVSAALLIEANLADDFLQVHPKDMQDGKIEVTSNDIICNLPFHEACGLWFDHHSSELSALKKPKEFKGLAEVAPSAAGLVYRYLLPDHPHLSKYEQLVHDTDLIDSANLTKDQILNPQGAFLLGFLIDPRTGLGLQHHFTISNFMWVSSLSKLLTQHSVEEILEMPHSRERVDQYILGTAEAKKFYMDNSRLEGNVVVTDLRGKKGVPASNRFLIYTLPGLEKGNISVRIADGKAGEFDTISVGYSIFNKTSKVDVGELCKKFGGGGHKAVGTCQPAPIEADYVLKKIIEACQE